MVQPQRQKPAREEFVMQSGTGRVRCFTSSFMYDLVVIGAEAGLHSTINSGSCLMKESGTVGGRLSHHLLPRNFRCSDPFRFQRFTEEIGHIPCMQNGTYPSILTSILEIDQEVMIFPSSILTFCWVETCPTVKYESLDGRFGDVPLLVSSLLGNTKTRVYHTAITQQQAQFGK
ncbi:hypothetical protein BT69DRAFT_1298213 [Atractiella rhizophila]|nr:hypothetical protein BT69DRAFT_1298213 [Atractiella rhizophila]